MKKGIVQKIATYWEYILLLIMAFMLVGIILGLLLGCSPTDFMGYPV